MAKKVFLIDVARCMGCYSCQTACKDEHCGNDWSPYAKPQPDIGQFWLHLKEYTWGTTPKVQMHYVPTLCNHCENAPCMAADTNGAISRSQDGFVIIEPEKAAGQKQLVDACPYGAIYWNEELNIAQKCTGCAHLLDNGYEQPRCVEACPTDCIKFGEEADLADDILGATTLQPELGTKPRVYYRNMPGKFIAGEVVDPEAKEVVIGATVRAVTGGKVYKTVTDEFGDFWFKDLAIGKFDVTVEAKGYKPVYLYNIDTRDCANLGNIMLEKE